MTLQLLINLEKIDGPFVVLCLRVASFLSLFWTRFGPLEKSRSDNPSIALFPNTNAMLTASNPSRLRFAIFLCGWFLSCCHKADPYVAVLF